MERVYKNTAEISLEELNEYKNDNPSQTITILNPNKTEDTTKTYSIDEMIQIKQKISDIISDIPQSIDEPDKEKKIFTYLYSKLAFLIDYDEFAASTVGLAGYDRDMTEKYRNVASNLIGGLINGKSMCSGYSEILRNVMSEIGIECIYINGDGKDNGGAHAWNQVKLDGQWYNVDLTNDRDALVENAEPTYFLKSNADFVKYEEYDLKSSTLHQCKESYKNPHDLLEQFSFTPIRPNSKSIVQADMKQNLPTSVFQNIKSLFNRLLNKEKNNIEK